MPGCIARRWSPGKRTARATAPTAPDEQTDAARRGSRDQKPATNAVGNESMAVWRPGITATCDPVATRTVRAMRLRN